MTYNNKETEPAKQASDKSVLLAELLDSNIPKSEREHVAVEEIHSLESLLHKQGWDIERLKITIKQLQDEVKLQNKDWCDDDEAIKQQALRVLPKEVVEGDSVHVPRMGELAEMMADEIEKLKEENKQLRLGWCKESEKRQGEWQNEPAKTPIKISAIDTLCHHCNGVGQIETRIVYDMKTPYSVHGWAICHRCAGKGHL